MVLSIEDPDTDRMARPLARLTGESLTDAVRTAIRDRLEREERRHGKRRIDRAEIDAIVARLAALPVVDDRLPDELVGYKVPEAPGVEGSGSCFRPPG